MDPMFYFLLALTAVLAVTAAPILDTDGDIILDGSYYALPSDSIRGGLALLPDLDHQCPLYIGQTFSELDRGIPVKFSNWNSKVRFVPESESLNIEMDIKATTCGVPTYWWISAGDVNAEGSYVTGGPKPEHGEELSKSFFQIKKAGENLKGYKIVVCPDDYEECMDVGIVHKPNHYPCLGFSNWARYSPLQVVFVKGNGTEETLSKTMSIM